MPAPVKLVFLEPLGSQLQPAPTARVKVSFTQALTRHGPQTKVTASGDSLTELKRWLNTSVPHTGTVQVHAFRWLPEFDDYLESERIVW